MERRKLRPNLHLVSTVQINTYNTRSIMIPEDCVPEALELLRD